VKVILTRKLADRIDGIDLTRVRVGDAVEFPQRDAELLTAEGWAVPERRRCQQPVAHERRRTPAC
jgi:hypothetical protein